MTTLDVEVRGQDVNATGRVLAPITLQLVYGQQAVPLSLDGLYNYNSSSRSPLFSLPAASNLSVSVALCADATSLPRFFVTNDSTIPHPSQQYLGVSDVYEITLNDGYGQWSGIMDNGGYLAVTNAQVPFEVGASDQGECSLRPLHTLDDIDISLPLLGDTTSNQALLFSPPIASAPVPENPSYPNYTLSSANLSYPVGPSSPLGVTLSIFPTSSSSLSSLPRTGCALRNSSTEGFVNVGAKESEGLWLKNDDGWRWQWVVNGLQPQTNYTVFAVTNGTHVSGPINFVTKSGKSPTVTKTCTTHLTLVSPHSAAFSCPIVHSLPYCPSINYAVPITPPSNINKVHDANTLPSDVTDPLLQTLTNFTVSLTTFPCGRDDYSPLVTCADCQRAYRKWLCTVWFPRCSESSPSTSLSANSATNTAQQPVSAIQALPASATPRSPGLQPFASSYDALLPCLETCTAADRACPIFLGFKCPLPRFNAASSYGVGFIDSGQDGQQGGGLTGVAQDRYGNVWCNEG
ncbi:hypothetical protein EIP86_010381 [Pleurotus ostreatoroseus]|nr:hypothetical protein EIP86_010381 [Pleurotus ostreatoroseus]